MPADKMVSYPMQNNGSLDEEAFFFAQGSAHCGVPRALPFGNPQFLKKLSKTFVFGLPSKECREANTFLLGYLFF